MRAAAVVVGLLLASGCASQDEIPPVGPPTPTGQAPAEAVAWMDNLCGVTTDLRTALWGSAAGGVGGLKQRLQFQLDSATTALSTAVEQLDALPATPVAGGDEAAADLSGRLADLRNSLQTAHDELSGVPADASDAELGTVMGEVWPQAAARAADPLDGVPVTEEMKAAATAASCAALPGLK